MIDRRALIVGTSASMLIAPLSGRPQSARKVYRIGLVGNFEDADTVGPQPKNSAAEAFLRGMRELGYVYGEHFVTEPRGSAGQPERFPSLAAEVVGLQVDVIVAVGTAMPAVKQATATIPIVMAAASDPVGYGFVRSLAHPGGNITGLSLQAIETTGKRLEMLRELIAPSATVAVLWDQGSSAYWRATEAAARARGWKLLSIEIRDAGEVEQAFKAAAEARAGAVLVFAAGHVTSQPRRVAEWAAASRLPAMYELRRHAEAGGLMSYGPDIDDIWRRAAAYVDKILKGAKPADLPVEQPTKFELVINLNTAKALGITIPQSLLLRADEVIQ